MELKKGDRRRKNHHNNGGSEPVVDKQNVAEAITEAIAKKKMIIRRNLGDTFAEALQEAIEIKMKMMKLLREEVNMVVTKIKYLYE